MTGNTPVISETNLPQVFRYSAPPCAAGGRTAGRMLDVAGVEAIASPAGFRMVRVRHLQYRAWPRHSLLDAVLRDRHDSAGARPHNAGRHDVRLMHLQVLSAAPENWSILAGRKGPAARLRYGQHDGHCGARSEILSLGGLDVGGGRRLGPVRFAF